jgi:DNA topoisomerase-2
LDILNAFYDVRVDYYNRRKLHLLGKLTEEWEKLDNKVRFILAVIAGKLVVSNRKKIELLGELRSTGFKIFVDKKGPKKADEEAEEEDEEEGDVVNLNRGYDYLLSMKIWSLTMEKVQGLTAERNTKKDELDLLASKTAEDLWLEDLDALEVRREPAVATSHFTEYSRCTPFAIRLVEQTILLL